MAKYYLKEDIDEFQALLDSINKKAGNFYYDTTNNRYLVFTDEKARDSYLETMDESLVIGTFDAPFNYSAEITLSTPAYNTIFFGSTGNVINFTFDVKNKQGSSTGENVVITYTIIKGSKKTTFRESRAFGSSVSFNVDRYLEEGTNTIMINVMGQTTLAATTVAINYEVVNLSLVDHLDISKVYNLSDGKVDYLEIPYDVDGSYTKIMEWYIDGVQLDFNRSDDEILETVPVSRTKTIELNNLSHGRHSIQFRVGTRVNGELFYSDILYRDFFVFTGLNDHIMLGLAVEFPSSYGIISAESGLSIPNMVQYIGYNLQVASYSPLNIAKTEVLINLDQETIATISSSNNRVTTVPIVPTTAGGKILSLVANEVELESQVTYEVPVTIAATSMNLTEITSGLKLDFTANGRNNNSTNRAEWSQGNITGTLTGFKWNNTSGWVNNRLEIDTDSELHIGYAPLSSHDNGKTIEIEWMSKNVSNEDAVLCDLTNDEGTGILITASSVIVTSEGKVQLEEKYKSNENVRVGIVINPSNRGTNKGLTFIYTNGVVSRSANVVGGDNYVSNKEISFRGSSEAHVSLKSIKVFDAALTSDQMLNNFNLYRDTVSEMYDVYDRNDIYEGNQISPTKMASRLPVMIVTGDIPTLENTNDKDTQIVVDIEYINMQDVTRSFIMRGAAMRPQGTSSMGYPKKNFRIYTRKLEDTILEVNGKVVEDKLYSFKEGAIPVDCWCLKADYAESSGTHNTGIAKLWGNAFKNARVTCDLGEGNPHNVNEATVLRTRAQQCAIDSNYPYDVRTTIDGFPILLFYRRTANDNVIFIGKYNFNNDKSTELVFGFEDIPGYDNSKTQCWESLNNGNSIGLFTDLTDFYNDVVSDGKTKKGWELAFEARYPDKSTKTEDLYAFATWINGVNGDHTRFAQEKWDHMDVYKMAGYYCYWNRHAAADQLVKNSMLTSEDGVHFFFILYDNDTVNGLINTGAIAILPIDNRESTYVDGSHKFAGYDSVLWNMLEADDEFQVIVRAVDNALYTAGISYGNAIATFDEQQADKWAERVYNLDAEYKYITPYTQNGINNLFMLQGKRELHRRWWLANRFSLYDSLFVSGAYKSGYVEIKCIDQTQPTQTFKVTSGYPIYYGYGINGNLRQRTETPLQPNQSQVFSITEAVNLGDPIAIYGAPHIKELDLSPMVDRIAVLQLAGICDNDLGTKLEKLTIGSFGKTNVRLQEVSGIKNATALKHLDITNLSGLTSIDLSNNFYLQELYALGTNISSIVFAEGAPINYLVLPATFKNIDFRSLPALSFAGIIHVMTIVESIKISDCPNLSNDFNWVYNWYTSKGVSNEKAVLHMDNIMWEEVDPHKFLELANIKEKQLKGKVKLSEGSQEIVDSVRAIFGDNVFNKSSDFYVQVGTGAYLSGPSKILEGESAKFVASIFTEVEGDIEWKLMTARTGCSINPKTGLLTTTETGQSTSELVVRMYFDSYDGSVSYFKEVSITIEKRVYPSSIEIEGAALISSEYSTFNLQLISDTAITGDYTIEWVLSDSLNNVLEIAENTNKYCKLRKKSDELTDGTLTARLRRRFDNVILTSKTKNISVVIEGVVITSTSNQYLQKALYEAGLVENEGYSLKKELSRITSSDLNPTGTIQGGIFYKYRYKISSLMELKFFTGVTELVRNSFYSVQVTDFYIPDNVRIVHSDWGSLDSSYLRGVHADTLEHYCSLEYDGSDTQEALIKSSETKLYIGGEEIADLIIPETANIAKMPPSFFPKKLNTLTFNGSHTVRKNSFVNSRIDKIIFNGDVISSERSYAVIQNSYLQSIEINENCRNLSGVIDDSSYGRTKECSIIIKGNDKNISGLFKCGVNCTISFYLDSIEQYFSFILSSNLLHRDTCKLFINGVELEGKVELPHSCINLHSYQLGNTKVEEVVLHDNITTIPSYWAYGSSYLKRVIGGKYSKIDIYSFYLTSSLENIDLPETLTSIGNNAFYGTGLKNLFIPSNVNSISDSAFTNTDIESVVVDPLNTTYDSRDNCNAIINSKLNMLVRGSKYTHIVESIKIIGPNAFSGSTLTSIIIPASISEIRTSAFEYCNNINSVYITDIAAWCNIMFGNNKATPLFLAKNLYLNEQLIEELIIPGTIISISSYAFSGGSFKKVTIQEGVSSIKYDAFDSCASLTSVVLPESLMEIGASVFEGCTNLKQISSKNPSAPTANSPFGMMTSAFTGRNTYNTGENILYVPQGATGYDKGSWLDPLQNASKCGFTISYTL